MLVNSVVNKVNFGSNHNDDRKMKACVAAASILSTGTALACIAKHQGFSLKPSAIKNTPVKDWAIFKVYSKKNPNAKLLEIERNEILQLASASVAGGLAGGIIFDDKKHVKAKLREAVNQILGNVLIPVICVDTVSKFYKNHKKGIISKMPQLKGTGKFAKQVNKALQGIPFLAATAISLGTGIWTGNKFSNYLNEKVFKKKVERNIKPTDFAPHVDDIGLAVTLMAEKSPLSTFITRTVPAFLCVPGYETGTHR